MTRLRDISESPRVLNFKLTFFDVLSTYITVAPARAPALQASSGILCHWQSRCTASALPVQSLA